MFFFFFLLAGLFTDLALWYAQAEGVKGVSLHLFNTYSVCEALFFFWLIRYVAPEGHLKKVAGLFLFATPLAGILLLLMPVYESGKTAQSIPFSTSYEVVAAFLAGFALLSLAERDNRLMTLWEFWFMLGVFFYCFTTFFVMTLLGSKLSLNLWPLNNVINILTYLCYSIGWWRYDAKSNSGSGIAPTAVV